MNNFFLLITASLLVWGLAYENYQEKSKNSFKNVNKKSIAGGSNNEIILLTSVRPFLIKNYSLGLIISKFADNTCTNSLPSSQITTSTSIPTTCAHVAFSASIVPVIANATVATLAPPICVTPCPTALSSIHVVTPVVAMADATCPVIISAVLVPTAAPLPVLTTACVTQAATVPAVTNPPCIPTIAAVPCVTPNAAPVVASIAPNIAHANTAAIAPANAPVMAATIAPTNAPAIVAPNCPTTAPVIAAPVAVAPIICPTPATIAPTIAPITTVASTTNIIVATTAVSASTITNTVNSPNNPTGNNKGSTVLICLACNMQDLLDKACESNTDKNGHVSGSSTSSSKSTTPQLITGKIEAQICLNVDPLHTGNNAKPSSASIPISGTMCIILSYLSIKLIL